MHLIVTVAKKPEVLRELLTGMEQVFLVGCSGCAEAFGNGGTAGILRMRKLLGEWGKAVVGELVVDFACEKSLTGLWLSRKAGDLASAECVLVGACGVGVQSVSALVSHKVVIASCDTVSLGGRVGQPWGPEMCRECGDCQVHLTCGVCPISRCAKGLLNGPCGGSRDGTCEVFPDRRCAWVEIWERMLASGRSLGLERTCRIRDHRKSLPPDDVRGALTEILESVVGWKR